MTEQRSLEELHAASERLWREYWMLRCVARATSDDPAVAHALEESFALHLRNLYRFLYTSGRSEEVAPEDFLGEEWRSNRPAPSALLIEAVAWAEQTLSPLRYAPADRGSGFSRDLASPPRAWTLLQASFDLQKVMDPFISSTPRHLLGPRWKIAYEGIEV